MNEPVLFVSGENRYSPSHVLSAGAFWGELGPLQAAVCARLESMRHAQAEGFCIEDAVLQSASEAFRRAQGLRSARATEAWMSVWGVTVEAFTDYLEREALRLHYGTAAAAEPASGGPDSLSTGALWPDAVFNGTGTAWCHRLAARVAVAREAGDQSELPSSIFDPAAAPGLAPDALRTCIDRFGLPHAWFDQMVHLESTHARFAESLLTPERLGAALRARGSDFFVLDLETGGFSTDEAAREACLCVTEDRLPIEQVCAMAGGQYWQGRVLLGDVPGDVRAHALSATAGALLPIFAWDGQYVVCRVLGKSDPTLNDARTRNALSGELLAGAVAPLVKRHILWPTGSAG